VSLRGPALGLALAGLLLAPTAAQGRTTYTNHIPNGGEFGCDVCHLEEPWLDPFGVDVGLTFPLGNVDWALVWPLDSDGDGQSNGFELGDPCGDWARGGPDPERENDLADPSDPDSLVPDDVPPPDCGPVADDDDSAVDDDDDSAAPPLPEPCGYSVVAGRPSALGAALAFGLLALGLASRRSGR
jgi:hypothetical protein